MTSDSGYILVLGGGINGAAVARELVLAGLDVCLAERGDVAGGTTAYSSRLIHGGLRYLEYGEHSLVRESLAERERLLHAEPLLVRPLRLFIPIASRCGGWSGSLRRLLGRSAPPAGGRGLYLIRPGLQCYDWLAGRSLLPPHELFPACSPAAPPVDARRYRWLAAFSDAQLRYPERLVLELLEDARQAAAAAGREFHVLTRHVARLHGREVELQPLEGPTAADGPRRFAPAAIVNATGAWVDDTLASLAVPAERLIGGTKGTHLVAADPRLRSLLAGRGLYAEASDGRPIFILPLGPWTLIGTTDDPYTGPPETATATDAEIAYLRKATEQVVGPVDWNHGGLDWHYAGIRPLPAVASGGPAGITRRHFLHEHRQAAVPLVSLVGGKLTTCRSLAAQTAACLTRWLGRGRPADTRDRPLPGGRGVLPLPEPQQEQRAAAARQAGCPLDTFGRLWELAGTRAAELLGPPRPAACGQHELLADADLPVAAVRWCLRHEWAQTLEDLVERRLMLLYDPRLSRRTLAHLAALLVEAGRLEPSRQSAAVEQAAARLSDHFGRHVPAATT